MKNVSSPSNAAKFQNFAQARADTAESGAQKANKIFKANFLGAKLIEPPLLAGEVYEAAANAVTRFSDAFTQETGKPSPIGPFNRMIHGVSGTILPLALAGVMHYTSVTDGKNFGKYGGLQGLKQEARTLRDLSAAAGENTGVVKNYLDRRTDNAKEERRNADRKSGFSAGRVLSKTVALPALFAAGVNTAEACGASFFDLSDPLGQPSGNIWKAPLVKELSLVTAINFAAPVLGAVLRTYGSYENAKNKAYAKTIAEKEEFLQNAKDLLETEPDKG